jgi:hypothetical protein
MMQLADIPSQMLVLKLRPKHSAIVETTRNGKAEIIETAKAHAIVRHTASKIFRNILTSQSVYQLSTYHCRQVQKMPN